MILRGLGDFGRWWPSLGKWCLRQMHLLFSSALGGGGGGEGTDAGFQPSAGLCAAVNYCWMLAPTLALGFLVDHVPALDLLSTDTVPSTSQTYHRPCAMYLVTTVSICHCKSMAVCWIAVLSLYLCRTSVPYGGFWLIHPDFWWDGS